jgi:hypothetical protein
MVLITLAVLSTISGLVLQASLHTNVFDLLFARYLLLAGATLGSIGLMMWPWKQ